MIVPHNVRLRKLILLKLIDFTNQFDYLAIAWHFLMTDSYDIVHEMLLAPPHRFAISHERMHAGSLNFGVLICCPITI